MSTWKANPARVAEALRLLGAAKAESARDAHGAVRVLDVLRAAGEALACGASLERFELGADTRAAVRTALSPQSFELAGLEDAAVKVTSLLQDHEDATDANATAVSEALDARDRVENVILAGEWLLGAPAQLTRDQQAFLVEFSELVRPLVHRLTAFNEIRGEVAATVAPPYRVRFWWWCEGAAISPAAIANLAAVAELVACFPEARAELEAIEQAATRLRAVPAARVAHRTVTRLSEWVARHRNDQEKALQVAAASEPPRIEIVSTAEYDVSWRSPASVVVDIFVEPRAGATPDLRFPSGRTLGCALVPRTVHRYTLALDPAALAEEAFVVVIPLAGGDVEIAIPPTDR